MTCRLEGGCDRPSDSPVATGDNGNLRFLGHMGNATGRTRGLNLLDWVSPRTLEYVAANRRLESAPQSVYSITGARSSLSDDQDHRKRVYLIAMSLRVLCFLAAIIIPAPLPIRASLAAAAIFLPYFAVVVANASRRQPAAVIEAQTGSYTPDRPGLSGRQAPLD
jgi:hypothetical protein